MNRRELLNELEKRTLVADGAMGSLLTARGLPPGVPPDWFCIDKPDAVRAVHEEYISAGARIIFTNTFCATRRRLVEFGLARRVRAINEAAVKIAREASAGCALVAGDIGPSGEYVEPLGTQPFDKAYDNFREQADVLAKAGVDIMVVETMSDLREMKAALLAVRDVYDGLVLASMTFSEGDRTVTGTPPSVAAVVMDAVGADIIGVNCSAGPEGLIPVIEEMARYTSKPLAAMPNAGLPRLDGDLTVWDMDAGRFASFGRRLVEVGVSVIGGCCGTTPAHIKQLSGEVTGLRPGEHTAKGQTFVASRTRTVELGKGVTVIGERINPTARSDLTRDIREGRFNVVRAELEKQASAGADMVDINVGVPGVDEAGAMKRYVSFADRVSPFPLSVDSTDPAALEAGLVEVSGKPLLNSITGEEKRLQELLPMVKRYGAAFVGLTLNDDGIPETADGRFAVAERIVDSAIDAGIPVENVVIDCLMMTAAQSNPAVTLEAVRLVKYRLGVKTLLGISNVSHGLPERGALNASVLLTAVGNGLDAAIVNPYDPRIAEALGAIRVMQGLDLGARLYTKEFGVAAPPKAAPAAHVANAGDLLYEAVLAGYREEVTGLVRRLLDEGKDPVKVNEEFTLPALEEVGRRFEKREYYLPQVILSAEAVQEAFKVLEPLLEGNAKEKLGRVVLATVLGDVHDIGKNIVASVMRGHGFEVEDLGKNVPADAVVKAARTADAVALSALMTTTMPEMGAVVKALGEAKIGVPVFVGGAVVDEAYAEKIGAFYAPDAVEAVKLVKKVLRKA